jgi:hypothetical protein
MRYDCIRMKFQADAERLLWQGRETIAALCEEAALWREEAEAVRLVTLALALPQVAERLATWLLRPVGLGEVRRWLCRAERLLKRLRPDLVERQRASMRELLGCLRNVRSSRPQPVVYQEHFWGYDREPIRLRSRLDGEVPDDLMRQPWRFLRDLPLLVADAGGPEAPSWEEGVSG